MRSFCTDLAKEMKKDRKLDVKGEFGERFMRLVKGDDYDPDIAGAKARCPAAFLLFYGISEEVDLAIYMMRVLATGMSGFTDGLMMYHVWYGPLGGNLKGTLRKLVDEMIGVFDGTSDRGYSAVLPPDVLTTFGKPEAPSEVESNMNGSRFVFCDDFVTDSTLKLNSALVRRYTGDNKLSSARKNKGNLNFDPSFSLNLLTNQIPEWKPKLIGSDLRRYVLVKFLISYRDENLYDKANKCHRLKKASIKRDIHKFFPEVMWWVRCLVQTLQLTEDSVISHQPESVRESGEAMQAEITCSQYTDQVQKFVLSLVKVSGTIEYPSSVTEVKKALEGKVMGLTPDECVRYLSEFLVETTAKRKGADGKPKFIRCYELAGQYLKLPVVVVPA